MLGEAELNAILDEDAETELDLATSGNEVLRELDGSAELAGADPESWPCLNSGAFNS